LENNCRVTTADTNKKIESIPRLSQTSLRAGKEEPLKSDRGLFSKTASRIPKLVQSKDLNQRILEAEKQLEGFDSQNPNLEEENFVDEVLRSERNFITDEEDSQTDGNFNKMVDRKQMILPGNRDAPKFSATKPKELRRFIRQMEDLWREAGIEESEEKKESLGKYADQESEEEWKALDTYGISHGWEEFKKEILENYPEAAAAERGTPARIRHIVKETDGIELGDVSKLYAYRRAFLAEANKLMKAPAVMSNRELVELFFGGLSLGLGQAVLQYLGGNTRGRKTGKEPVGTDGTDPRRPEDRYDLEEVCRAAGEVCENAQGMLSYRWMDNSKRGSSMMQGYVPTITGPTQVSNKLDSLEQTQALEHDRLDAVNKQWGVRFDGLEALIKNLLGQPQPSASFIQNVGQGSGGYSHSEPMANRTMKNSSGLTEIICYGCGISGHFQNNCEKVKNLVQGGAIIYNKEGKVCLPDGSRVPNIPIGGSLLERVEKYYGGLKPSQMYYGAFEEMEDKMGGVVPRETSGRTRELEGKEQQLARLEKELEARENALLAKQFKLEARAPEKLDIRSYISERLEEELKSMHDDKPGFL